MTSLSVVHLKQLHLGLKTVKNVLRIV